MVTWSLLPEGHDDETWNEVLQGLPDGNPFQGSAWAAHKRNFGWKAVRLVARAPDGAPTAAAQFLLKRRLGFSVLWARGGPLGDPGLWGEGLINALRRAAGPGPAYARFCSYRTLEWGKTLGENGWARPARPFDRNLTFRLELSSEESLLKGLSSNWSHNLRRGLKRCAARAWENPDPSELLQVYRDMESYKAMPAQYGESELASLLAGLGPALLLHRADDAQGRPIALRACAVQGKKAWDLLAASSQVGRQNYASYHLLWKLLERCRALGVDSYDLGGADPERAKGVYDFKKGTGAAELEYLGEWDWARPGLCRVPAGAALSRWTSKA